MRDKSQQSLQSKNGHSEQHGQTEPQKATEPQNNVKTAVDNRQFRLKRAYTITLVVSLVLIAFFSILITLKFGRNQHSLTKNTETLGSLAINTTQEESGIETYYLSPYSESDSSAAFYSYPTVPSSKASQKKTTTTTTTWTQTTAVEPSVIIPSSSSTSGSSSETSSATIDTTTTHTATSATTSSSESTAMETTTSEISSSCATSSITRPTNSETLPTITSVSEPERPTGVQPTTALE